LNESLDLLFLLFAKPYFLFKLIRSKRTDRSIKVDLGVSEEERRGRDYRLVEGIGQRTTD